MKSRRARTELAERTRATGALGVAVFALACSGSVAAQEPTRANAAPAAVCAPRNAITATVKSIIDGRTFTLADGREVRLAAIDVADTAAHEALAEMAVRVPAHELILSPLVPAKDRYGRLNMRAFMAEGAMRRSVEDALVSQGAAFAMPRGDDDACMALLLDAERTARSAKLGLWSDAVRRTMQAQNPSALTAAQGKFAVIDGKVLSVRESGGSIYVNFGRRWSEDFTVTIPKREARTFADAGIEPKSLAGRNIRVRGVIEERGGPWIEATIPEQIEIADDR